MRAEEKEYEKEEPPKEDPHIADYLKPKESFSQKLKEQREKKAKYYEEHPEAATSEKRRFVKKTEQKSKYPRNFKSKLTSDLIDKDKNPNSIFKDW